MNKAQLSSAVAADLGISVEKANDAVNSIIRNITKSLKKGDKVTLVGFGAFSVAKRAARSGRNPQTGKPMKIEARKVAKFSPGKLLKETINPPAKKK